MKLPADTIDDDLKLRAISEFGKTCRKYGIEQSEKKDITISIVIPVYNERERFPKTVMETTAWCRENGMQYEIVISDDGSSDDTLEIARIYESMDKNIKVIACPHRGKGAAVRIGMLNSIGDYVLYMDADGATPLYEIPKLLKMFEKGCLISIGSRVVENPNDTVVEMSFHRKMIGRIFSALVKIFGVRGISDTQCGFKMFKNEVVHDLFSRQKIDGFAFDVEILYLANKLLYPIMEVPITWFNREGSKVDLVADGIKMFKDIMKIRVLHFNLKDHKHPH